MTHRRGIGDALVDTTHRHRKRCAVIQLDGEVAGVRHSDARLQQGGEYLIRSGPSTEQMGISGWVRSDGLVR